MHRCFIEPAVWSEEFLDLSPDEARHLAESMRARVGDRVAIFDGAGRVGEAEVVSASGGRQGHVCLHKIQEKFCERPRVAVTLVQALPKGRRMDDIVERATELGASSILGVVTDRTIVRSAGDRDDFKSERWKRVALSAAKQCGVPWLPEISGPMSFKDAIRRVTGKNYVLLASLLPEAEPIRQVLSRVHAAKPTSIALIIGPEGDLTEAESRIAIESGSIPVSFGTRVLRVEMAALYGLSVLVYECEAG